MDALPRDGLPLGWAVLPLAELLNGRGESVDPARFPDTEFVLYSVPAHEAGRPERVRGRDIGSTKQRVAPGTVLLCKINPRINRAWRVEASADGSPLIASTEWITFPRSPAVEPEYLRLFLMREPVRRYLAANASGVGGSLMRVNGTVAGALELPLAPLGEQTRIVAAVNALFEEVEAGEAALARAREGLTQFRASLLHAACTGALTADWRAANPTNETGGDLLAQLLGQRRARWEADFRANATRAGKRLRDDTWKARYPTPRNPDLNDMPALPDGWTWASLDQLSHDSNYGTSVKCDVSADGLAVLRIPNVQAGAVTWSNLKFATADLGLETADLLAPGDLLIVRTNGSPDLVGRAALVTGAPERRSYFASYLIRFRLVGSPTVQRWVARVFRSGLVRTQVARFAATSAGQYNVSQTNLAGFAIPLPPESEIEAALNLLTEAAADEGTLPADGFADALRQSILHAAFTGRLVPQDPADEPAAALLARLRATPAAPRRPRARRIATQPDLIETPA